MSTPSPYVGRQVLFGAAYGEDETALPLNGIITEIVDDESDPVIMNVHVYSMDFESGFMAVPQADELTIGYWTFPDLESRP